MRAYNKKKKPKHWVLSHWNKEDMSFIWSFSLKGMYKPKDIPYPIRREYLVYREQTKLLTYRIKPKTRKEIKEWILKKKNMNLMS